MSSLVSTPSGKRCNSPAWVRDVFAICVCVASNGWPRGLEVVIHL